MIKTRYKFFLTLTSILAFGVGSIHAADEGTATTPPPAETVESSTPAGTPMVVTGTIVLIDRTTGTITVKVNGKLQLLKVGKNVKMVNNGKLVALSDLAAGQEIVVLTRAGLGGSQEIVALSVEPTRRGQTAAGSTLTGKSGSATSRPVSLTSAPFPTLANPANSRGPVISPSE